MQDRRTLRAAGGWRSFTHLANCLLVLLMCTRGVCICQALPGDGWNQGMGGMMHAGMNHGGMTEGMGDTDSGAYHSACAPTTSCCCEFAALHQPAVEILAFLLILFYFTRRSPARCWVPQAVCPETEPPPPKPV